MWSGGRTNTMLDMLVRDAINRGVLTALSSAVNMALVRFITVATFSIYLLTVSQSLALPNTFFGLAPSSKC
jgi:hypothetical protein